LDLETDPRGLEDLPDHLASEGSFTQEMLTNLLFQRFLRSSRERDSYEERQELNLTFSNLLEQAKEEDLDFGQTMFKYMLRYKVSIRLTDKDCYRLEDPLLHWDSRSSHRLDYICAVGNKLGLHAALMNRESGYGYEFRMNPNPRKTFRGKFAQLGFDQKGSLLYLGRRPGEEVYICMAPKATLSPEFVHPPPIGCCSGPSQLAPAHANVLRMFILHCLKQTGRSVYTTRDPFQLLNEETIEWAQISNVL